MTIINWARKTQQCHNLQLQNLLEEVFRILDNFDSFCVQHVYKECNMEADSLCKPKLEMGFGQWLISEDRNGTHFEYHHKHFIEDMTPVASIN
jgi:hypothetical protein